MSTQHSRPLRSRTVLLSRMVMLGICFAMVSGCGYSVGSNFPTEVQTVSVPVFKNLTFRRGLEVQLTEAVHREIKNRTPFRLVDEKYAQTRLIGEVVEVNKHVLGENTFDDPRMLELDLAVRVLWEDARTGQILRERNIALDPAMIGVAATGQFTPETGQSLATAQQKATIRVAERIVDLMEVPW